MTDAQALAELFREAERRLGRQLTNEERVRLARQAVSGEAVEAQREPKRRVRRAAWTVLGLLLVGWPVTLWGLFLLLDWSWPSVSSFLATFADRYPLVVFAAATALFVPLLALLIGLLQPSGSAISRTHIWVLKGTRSKVKDATVREAYDHEHGAGSWSRKATRDERILWAVGLLAAGGLPPLLASWFIPTLEADTGTFLAAAFGGMLVYAITVLAMVGASELSDSTPAPHTACSATVLETHQRSFSGQHPALALALLVAVTLALLVAVGSAGFIAVRGLVMPEAFPEGVFLPALGYYAFFLAAAAVFGLVTYLGRRRPDSG